MSDQLPKRPAPAGDRKAEKTAVGELLSKHGATFAVTIFLLVGGFLVANGTSGPIRPFPKADRTPIAEQLPETETPRATRNAFEPAPAATSEITATEPAEQLGMLPAISDATFDPNPKSGAAHFPIAARPGKWTGARDPFGGAYCEIRIPPDGTAWGNCAQLGIPEPTAVPVPTARPLPTAPPTICRDYTINVPATGEQFVGHGCSPDLATADGLAQKNAEQLAAAAHPTPEMACVTSDDGTVTVCGLGPATVKLYANATAEARQKGKTP